jgi:integrase
MARKGYITRSFTLPDGNRKYVYGKTKQEAEEKLLQAKMQMAAGVDLTRHDTFGEFAQLWFNTFKRGKVKPQSEAQIKSRLNNHIMPYLSNYQMSKITPMQCAGVFTKMTAESSGNGLQRQVYQIMKQIFNVAVENGVILRSPMTDSVKPGGAPAKKRKALTPAQVSAIQETVKGTTLEAFVQIALGTGLRQGEIYALHWEDVDLDAGEVYVHRTRVTVNNVTMIQEQPKSDAGVRHVPFGKDVKRAFQLLRFQKNGPLVFHNKDGNPTSDAVHSYRWHKYIGSTEFPGVTAHSLRHTAITNWFDQGLDVKEVQYLAGHANATITMNIYTDYLKEKRYEDTKAKIQGVKQQPDITA